MFFNRIYFFIVLALLITAFLLFNFNSLAKEYRLANIYGAARATIDLQEMGLMGAYDSVINKFTQSNYPGFPIIDIYVPEKSFAILEKDLPLNIKEWVPAYFKYPDGDYHEVSIRYRGDNFINWAYGKKSFRLKLKKKDLINRKRVFNFTILSSQDTLPRYIPYYLGKLTGVPTPDFDLIELRVNGVSQGVYLFYDEMDEGFLRRNNFMPVNLYKGEQFHTGRDLEKGVELFNNPSLWTKEAIFNQRSENDFNDLSSLISQLRQAENSPYSFEKLKSIIDMDTWAKFDAFQALIQSKHNDDEHNMRIISDVWKGQFIPIIYESFYDTDPNLNFAIDNPKHSLLKILNSSSDFIHLKYNYLTYFLSQDLLTQASDHAFKIKEQFFNSYSRDSYKQIFRKISAQNIDYSSSDWDKASLKLKDYETKLNKEILAIPKSGWRQEQNIISLSINGIAPIKNPVFIIQDIPKSIPKIYFDNDQDGKISNGDIYIPTKLIDNKLYIEAIFYANRILSKSKYDDYPLPQITNTSFNLISDTEFRAISSSASHPFSGAVFDIKNTPSIGHTPLLLNKPILTSYDDQDIVTWSGRVIVSDDLVIENPINIMPGTEIILGKGASIIFRNKVFANGLSQLPISFRGDKDIWGSIIVIGKKTEGSIFNNVIVNGGSGYDSPNLRAVGMFSLHNTANVTLNNMHFSNNHIYDDLIHIVYSSNIILKNCLVRGSLFDAIDIDISDVEIDNCSIYNSGNDAIDSMSSVVKVKNTNIEGSLDKGISVGEDSEVLVLNSFLSSNNIGIESKDDSSAIILNSSFINNITDVNAYKKNWQYGSGGFVHIYDNSLQSGKNILKADKNSLIYFYEISEKTSVKRMKNIKSRAMSDSELFEKISGILNQWEELESFSQIKQNISDV